MRRAQRRKYHYFYKTTCLITNRYYYGIHSTDNLDDGYIGSGKRLWYSINKHGRENHICEKLEFFDTRENLKKREKEVVNENLLKDPMCMNLAYGGSGGPGNKFLTKEQLRKGALRMNEKTWKDPEFIKRHKRKSSLICKKMHKEGKMKAPDWTGKKHTEETIEKMKKTHVLNKHQQGSKNSQYGTCWVHNNLKNKKIKKEELNNYLNNNWIKGRKM